MIVIVGPCGREVAEARLGWAGDPVARGPVLVVPSSWWQVPSFLLGVLYVLCDLELFPFATPINSAARRFPSDAPVEVERQG